MKRILLSFFFLIAVYVVQAQVGTVKGRLTDTTTRQVLAQATVSILNALDSSLVSFALSDKKGLFEIKDLPYGDYLMITSFTGFENTQRKFSLNSQKGSVDLGEMVLPKSYKTLEGVTVTDNAPVRIQDDTISFRADAFKTKPNATVEDLLKKLPGVQVQKDGTVNAMGETVQKVYVDGKEFFGNDPKLATKNITADMVEQVQVFDDMSEQSKFTKIDDGSRSKTINIKLKKDRNKGSFGKAMIGAGNEKRYEGTLSYNNFKGDKRISFLGAANNINKQGFSFNDIISSMGGMGSLRAGMTSGGFGGMGDGMMAMQFGGLGSFNTGITSSRSGGINYNDHWGRVDFRSSYHFSQSDNKANQNKYRQSYFPGDSLTETFTDNVSKNKNKNHRVNARWEYAMDSMSSVLYTININLQRSEALYNDTSYTFSDALNEYLAITSRTANENERNGINYNGELLLRRKLKKAGRTITLGWRNGFNESEGESFNRSPFVFYKPDGGVFTSRDQNYVSGQATRTNNNTLSTSYTEPLSHNRLLEFNYAYSVNKNTSDKRTFDYNTGTGKYDMLNVFQTNYFENTNLSSRFGANFREQQKKFNYQVGAGVQLSQLQSRSIQASTGKDTTIRQRFTNFFPSASFNFTPNKVKNVRFTYRGRTNAPSITQLQDVPDLSNPLQVRIGNPSLKQEFYHSVNLNYSTFNIFKFRFFAANLGFNATQNKIVNSIDSLNKATTITRPVNLDGAFATTAFLSIGFPIKKLKGSNLNFTTIGSFNRDVSELYKQLNNTKRLLLTQTFGFNYNHKEKLDMGINMSLTYNNARYSLQSSLDNEYLTQTYSADLSYTFKNNFILGTDLDYFINSGRTDGFNQSIPMWNASMARQFLKNKAGEIRFSVYDILNQNKSVNRIVGDNYYEDSRSNVIRRFFLLSFTYTLNKMGGKGQQLPPGIQKMIERGAKQFRIGG